MHIDSCFVQVMAEKKSSGGSEASTKEEPYGRKLSNKGRKSVSLSRPVRSFLIWPKQCFFLELVNSWISCAGDLHMQ